MLFYALLILCRLRQLIDFRKSQKLTLYGKNVKIEPKKEEGTMVISLFSIFSQIFRGVQNYFDGPGPKSKITFSKEARQLNFMLNCFN